MPGPIDYWGVDWKRVMFLRQTPEVSPELLARSFDSFTKSSKNLANQEGPHTVVKRFNYAFTVLERTFRDFGLPNAIRTDNGIPFSSRTTFFGLSRLPVWWLRLGINIERIRPGNPQQNGRHQRIHRTLKQEATKPVSFNFFQQQERFDDFIEIYNNDRSEERACD
jgi:transposase InsO family protein